MFTRKELQRMNKIDQRDRLKEEPFSYQITKAQMTRIAYEGRHIMTLSEKDTLKLIKKIQGADTFQAQLILAKVTGHFKH